MCKKQQQHKAQLQQVEENVTNCINGEKQLNKAIPRMSVGKIKNVS